MTNREKFKEVFGFDLNTENMHCISEGSCKDCPLAFTKALTRSEKTGEELRTYQYKYAECTDFWDDEYVEHDCTNCQHGDTDDTELPCRECGTGSENKWEPAGPKRSHIAKLAEKFNNIDVASMCPDDKCLQYAEADAEMCKKHYDAILACRNAANTMEMYNKLKNDKFGVEVPTSIVEHDIRIRDIEDRLDKIDRFMDDYDKKLILLKQNMNLYRTLGPDITKRIALEPMCHVDLSLDEIRKQFEEDLKNGNN